MAEAVRIEVRARVRASREKTWAAYVAPDDIVKWNAASDDWHTPRATSDLRPGGAFSYRMEARDGSFGFDFAGTWTRVEAPALLEYEFGGRAARVTFAEAEGGTDVLVAFDAETQNEPELQRKGWQAILDRFARHVEAKP